MPAQPHDAHTLEHEILNALDGPGCAVCALNRRAVEGWVDSLLNEGVTNVASRLAFREAGGLCSDHADMLERRGHPLGVAILMEDLLTQANPARLGRRFAVRCAACGWLREAEERYVTALDKALARGEARQRFQESPGLCVPHMRRLIQRVGRGREAWIRSACAAHLAPLSAELAEIIRKHDYRHRDESWGDEADAWRRAVARWRGDCVARG